MASFDVSYIIKAIDKVTPVVDKILDSVSRLDNSVDVSSRDFDKYQETIERVSDNIVRSIGKMTNLVTHDIRKVNDTLQQLKIPHIVPVTVPPIKTAHAEQELKGFFTRVSHTIDMISEKGDQIAMKGFYNVMNIMMPLMAFIKPFQDVMQQQQDVTAMKIQGFNQGQINKLLTQADILVKASAFDKATLVKTESMLASHGANVNTIRNLLPAIAKIAAATNQTLTQVTSQVNQAIWGKGQKAVGSLIVAGGTQAQRIQSLLNEIKTKYPDALKKQMQTAAGQLRHASNQISDSLQKIVSAALPALIKMAKVFANVASAVGDWLSEHKKLMEFFVYATGVVVGLVIAQIAWGAAVSGVGLALKGVKTIVKGLTGVMGVFGKGGWLLIGLAAIATATYEIYTHWGQITKAVKQFINENPALKSTIKMIKDGFQDIAKFIDRTANAVDNFLHKIGLSTGAIHGLKVAFGVLMGAGILIFFGKLVHLVGKLTGISALVKGVKSLAGFGKSAESTVAKTATKTGVISKAVRAGAGVLGSAADVATAVVTSTIGTVGAGLAGLLIPTEAGDGSRFSAAQMAQMLKQHPEWAIKKKMSANAVGKTAVHNHNHNTNINTVYIDGKKHTTATNKSSGFSQTYIGTPTLFLP